MPINSPVVTELQGRRRSHRSRCWSPSSKALSPHDTRRSRPTTSCYGWRPISAKGWPHRWRGCLKTKSLLIMNTVNKITVNNEREKGEEGGEKACIPSINQWHGLKIGGSWGPPLNGSNIFLFVFPWGPRINNRVVDKQQQAHIPWIRDAAPWNCCCAWFLPTVFLALCALLRQTSWSGHLFRSPSDSPWQTCQPLRLWVCNWSVCALLRTNRERFPCYSRNIWKKEQFIRN